MRVEDLLVAAVTNQNADAILVFEFLYQFTRLLRAYFGGKLNSLKLKANFPLVHELLEGI